MRAKMVTLALLGLPTRLRARAQLTSWTVLLVAVVAAGGLLAATAAAKPAHSTAGRISFYGDLANFINDPSLPNPRLVRPRILPLTEDGSVELQGLRWRGWGSSVARASGVLSASNCTPNCATGKRTRSRARLTLSRPGRVLGHRVYRCYRLSVPARPRLCLRRTTGKLIAYLPVSAPAATSAAVFWPGSAGITCVLKDNGTVQGAWVFCWLGSQWPPTTHTKMGLDGQLDQTTLIREPMGLGGPALQYGKSVRVGRFRCTSKTVGLSCIVLKTGKGLLIGPSGISQVGQP
jgi:hypothetical protein